MNKLHVGCGTLYKEGWINVDNNSDGNIKHLDVNADLSMGLPFDSNTIDFIYHEHFIEHLSFDEGLVFLKECYRVLKPSGVMRLACPDLKKIIEAYSDNTWREQDWVSTYGCQWITSRCHMINVCFSLWGHKFIYDEEELRTRLSLSGFNQINIKKSQFGISAYSELCHLDTRLDSMFFDVSK